MTHAPAIIRHSGPITGRLLRAGIPMGPNVVLTVRGRTSGRPRSAPVAMPTIEGRRYVVGTFGEVHWVRNLRAAGEAEVTVGGRREQVDAVELSHDDATRFFAELLPAYIRRMPVLWRFFVRLLVRLAAQDVFRDPAAAAAARPVFELRRRLG